MTFTRNIYPFSHLFLKKSVRLNYFLAASVYFSELDSINHDIALFLRLYGGLIGIDNSSLDKYLKVPKSLRLCAI